VATAFRFAADPNREFEAPDPYAEDSQEGKGQPTPALACFKHVAGSVVAKGLFPEYLLPDGSRAFFYHKVHPAGLLLPLGQGPGRFTAGFRVHWGM
jgi:hypothetical protein